MTVATAEPTRRRAPADPGPTDSVIEHPEYVAALARLNEVKHKLTAVQRRMNDVNNLSNERASNHRELRAQALADGATPPPPPEMPMSMQELYREADDLARAEEIAHKRLQETEARLSREICERLMPEFHAHVKRVRDAAAEVVAANEAYRAFRDRLVRGGTQLSAYQASPWPSAEAEDLERWEANVLHFHPDALS